ncbi:hypothetical protein FB45DRAFT_1004818 [Roridomyces roridus]|uniref:Uncharacterized protein n=1 Tax=Roridomyces roridus TaxID=1738132 RepID=A0AAD7BQ38_9AGAR|nr:hypothetical protein FB45DRAFT_1004818 [Roridomyces roridus]
MLNHIVIRGVAHLQDVSPEYIAKLEADRDLFGNSGYDLEVSQSQMLPVIITSVVMFLILFSIRYTVGNVVLSLAMIESPGTVAVVEKKVPAYSDEEPLVAGSDVDVEITLSVINRKPVTASLCGTMRLLRSAGGFFARWRGIGVYVRYGALHMLVNGFLSHILGAFILRRGIATNALGSIGASVMLARVHMLWTHIVITHPTSKSHYKRFVPRAESKPVYLPSLFLALAEQATILIPMYLAFTLGLLDNAMPERILKAVQEDDCNTLILFGTHLLLVFSSGVILALSLVLPASIALARIEAALLPAETPALVPFDRAALVGDIDLTARGAGTSRALFKAARRSADRASCIRVIKLYIKMLAAQTAVALVGVGLVAAEVYVIGGERLMMFITSAKAALELEVIQAWSEQMIM